MSEMVTISIDGKEIQAAKGDNLLKVARDNGFDIPGLCFYEKITPTGDCRLCMVKIEGRPGMVPSCLVKVEDGIEGHGVRRAAGGDAQDAGRRAALRAQRRLHHLRARRRLPDPGPGLPLRPGHAQAHLRPDLAGNSPGPGLHGARPVLRFLQVHQVRALRQGLLRDPGQGRAEHGPARHPQPRRGRHRRVVGLRVRRLRRVRPGLPGRRPDGKAGLRRQAEEEGRRAQSGHHLPVLRRRLPARALDQERQDRQGQGGRGGAQLRRHLRQGPLRPRFRAAPRPPDHSR